MKKITPIDQMAEQIDKVRTADIQNLAKKYFDREKVRLIIRGPIKDNIEHFEKLLDTI